MMGKQEKRVLTLDRYEHGVVVNALNEMRNDLLEEERPTDIVDEVLLKVIDSKKGLGRSAESHYPTMELEDIRALPVGTLAADDCVLFLWTTIPLLHDCFSVMRAWGFSYKTVAFVWIKQNRKSDSLFWGMGHWTRANAEFCMLATKGRPKRRSAGVHQVILSHIEEHSKKPDEARRRIVELMGDLPRIELFARQKADGWDVWGNEVACDIALTGGEPNVG